MYVCMYVFVQVADMYQLEESQVYKYCIVNMAAGDKVSPIP